MKKITIISAIIIVFAILFGACTSNGDEGTTIITSTTEITDKVETTTEITETAETTSESTTKRREKSTVPPLRKGIEEIKIYASDLPFELEGVTFKSAVLHKATKNMEKELSEYGDDPYLYNELYILAEGRSSDLKITYNTPYTGNVKSSFFYSDNVRVWSEDYGPQELQMEVEDGKEVTVSGFSSDIQEIVQVFRMSREILETKNVVVKEVHIIFI